MFDASVSAVLTALLAAFLGAFISRFFGVIVRISKAGSASSAESAQTIIGYMTVASENWVRVGLLSALMVFLAAGIYESRVSAA
jgi:hypothetical protein